MKYKWDPGHLADLIALYVDDIRAVSCNEEGCWKAMHMVSTLRNLNCNEKDQTTLSMVISSPQGIRVILERAFY